MMLGKSVPQVQQCAENDKIEIRYVHTPWIDRGVWRIVKEEIKDDGAILLTACLFKELEETYDGDHDREP